MANYNGLAYDPDINWNDPIKQYDEYGVCIFDPSLAIDATDTATKDIEDISDPGMKESEIVIGGSKEEKEEKEEKERSEADESDTVDAMDFNH